MRNFFIAVCASFMLCTPALADETLSDNASALDPKLDALELRLFAATHDREPEMERLARLEKFVYGSVSGGSSAQRCQNLVAAVTQKNPDGTCPAPLVVPESAPTVSIASANPALQTSIQRSESEMVPVPVRPLHLSLTEFGKVDYEPHRLIQTINDAITADPIFTADLFFQKAQAEVALRDYKAALKDLTDAILKEPMRFKYYLARACLYRKLGNPIMAQKDITTARFSNRDLPEEIEYDADTAPLR